MPHDTDHVHYNRFDLDPRWCLAVRCGELKQDERKQTHTCLVSAMRDYVGDDWTAHCPFVLEILMASDGNPGVRCPLCDGALGPRPEKHTGNWGDWTCKRCGQAFCQECGKPLDVNDECPEARKYRC